MKLFKLLKNEESGQTLAIALALLAFGSLLVVPILNLSGSTMMYHQTIETNTLETYAAGAGIEYALCELGNNPDTYKSSPLEHDFSMNNKSVQVTTDYIGDDVFKITSIATTENDSSTTIECYATVTGLDFTFTLDNAITSCGDVTLQPGTIINGDVQYNGDLIGNPGQYLINGDVSQDPIDWPSTAAMSSFYYDDVAGLPPSPLGYIDVSCISNIGPLYREGTIEVDNTTTKGAILTLYDTLYITGDLNFNQSGNKDYYLNLNDETIFVEGNIDMAPNTCAVMGSGCIIAIGDVNFQPQCTSSFNDFVLVMSLEGEVYFHPQGNFSGSIAGNIHVNLNPTGTITWTEPFEGINFPGIGDAGDTHVSANIYIMTWNISK